MTIPILISGIIFSFLSSFVMRIFLFTDFIYLGIIGITFSVFIMAFGAHVGLSLRGYPFTTKKWIYSSLILLLLVWLLVILPFQYSGFFLLTWSACVLLYANYVRSLEETKLRFTIVLAPLFACGSIFFSSGSIDADGWIDPFVFVWSLAITFAVPLSFEDVENKTIEKLPH